jgi:membrane-associated phospholipid phosphatase
VLAVGNVLGKPLVSLAIATALAAVVAQRRSLAAGVPIPLAAVVAFAMQKLAKSGLARARPPRAVREGKTEPSYPSGHVTTTVAVGLTAAYVLMKEELATAALSIPAAVAVAGLAGGSKLYDERHWTSDLLGGVLAGTSVAALCGATHLGLRHRADRAPSRRR